MIDQPGVYDLPADEYHADPCPEPSFSSSIAAILLDQSPRHAWVAHPRLNPRYKAAHRQIFDLGSAAHALLLGDPRAFKIIEAENYKTKTAQEARDAAYAAGAIPLLPDQLANCQAMVAEARLQLAAHRECSGLFLPGTGKPEQTVVWQENTAHGPVWCRARLDWLPNEPGILPDYKWTAGSAHPDAWTRRLYDQGYDIQCAFYRRGITMTLGVQPRFMFVVQESEPPFALSVIGLTPAALDMADRKVQQALDLWAWCLKNDAWPGYPARIAYVEPPVYAERAWLEREARDDATKARGKRPSDFLLHWQAPV